MRIFDIKKFGLEKALAFSALFFIAVLGLHVGMNALRYFTLEEIVQYQASLGKFSELSKYLWTKDSIRQFFTS